MKGLQTQIMYETCPQEIQFHGTKETDVNVCVGSREGALLLDPEGKKARDRQD